MGSVYCVTLCRYSKGLRDSCNTLQILSKFLSYFAIKAPVLLRISAKYYSSIAICLQTLRQLHEALQGMAVLQGFVHSTTSTFSLKQHPFLPHYHNLSVQNYSLKLHREITSLVDLLSGYSFAQRVDVTVDGAYGVQQSNLLQATVSYCW